ncbi:PilW family protein [Roseateles sp. DC23W]|uniref:PilW family protein n=1 Tax=Pelomonas dachongensis TaxID=3299029 RepID=A0ABW7ERU5_9BURK
MLNISRLSRSKGAACARGVTLIELMVGMVLGIVVVLVVAQVMSFAEGYKRATTGGADAQVNGSLAMYTLQREVQMAGYGLINELSVLGCTVNANHTTAGAFSWPLVPVVIMAGANDASDSVTVMYSSRPYSVPAVVSVDHPTTADRFTVRSAVGISVGDMVIAVPGSHSATNWCGAYMVTQLANTNQLVHGPSAWNSGANVAPAAGYLAGSLLVNAGQVVRRTFSVSAAYNLQQQTLNPASGALQSQDIFPQIVNLRALYGKDTNGDDVVDSYDRVTPTTNAGWQQVRSVRIALVARSSAFQKEEVTLASPVWDVGTSTTVAGATACGTSNCLTLKIDSVPDWKHYRYAVSEVTIPLRNVIWGG